MVICIGENISEAIMSGLVLTSLLLASCSTDSMQISAQKSRIPIVFDNYLERTTRSTENTVETIKTSHFGIFAFYKTDGDYSYNEATSASAGFQSNFMSNQMIGYENNSWTYTPQRYWPTSGKISFLAYAPYQFAKGINLVDKDNKSLKADNTDAKDQTCLTYATKNNCDLLISNALNQTQSTNSGVVNLHFYHALAKLGYKISLADNSFLSDGTTIQINSVKLTKTDAANITDDADLEGAFYPEGRLNLAQYNSVTGKPSWTGTSVNDGGENVGLSLIWECNAEERATNSRIMAQTIGTTELSSSVSTQQTDPSKYFFVIPQNFSESQSEFTLYVTVNYTLIQVNASDNSTSTSSTQTTSCQIKPNLKAGNTYLLNLKLNISSVNFTADVEDSQTSTDSNIDISLK